MPFVPHHRMIAPSGASKLAFVLHGALGSGQNFSRFIQRLAGARPDYRYALVDLRHHGHSTGAPGPDTLASCASDLVQLARSLGAEPDVLIGHSFGGKVALEFARQGLSSTLAQVWVLDSLPGVHLTPDDSEITRVIAAVRSVPMPAETRRAVVEHLTEQSGLSSGLAEWMATNLKREGDRYSWLFDVDAIETLMQDYFRVDLWGFLEAPRARPEIQLVVAARSDRWTPALRQRARALPPAARVIYRELPNSGHWVHVDNPDGLLQMMREHLSDGAGVDGREAQAPG